MPHLSMEELLALREPGSEPGAAAARAHLDECGACRAELDAVHQQVARLKALPTLRPGRDRWPAVALHARAERRARLARRFGAAGLALVAAVALIVTVAHDLGRPAAASATEQEITDAMQRSQALEAAINAYNPDGRVVDGRSARMAAELEDRIGALDRQLERVELEAPLTEQDAPRLQLWRERVGLLDALVDVHVTHASHVGL